MRGIVVCLSLVTLLSVASGCNMLRGGRLSRLLPPTSTYLDGAEEASDPWIAAAADEGRVEFAKEKEADPLGIRRFLTSQKARDIEKNVGIE